VSALVSQLRWKSIFLAILAAYAFPVVLSCTPVSLWIWHLALWVLAPLAAGYLVAKFTRALPYLHGLAASLVALAILTLLGASPDGVRALVWVALNLSCSIYGAGVWRARHRVQT
jgi:hypothetical protein